MTTHNIFSKTVIRMISKKIFGILLVATMLFSLVPAPAFAYYAPGETMNPSCAPGASGCDISPTIAVSSGGTGITSFTAGDLLYASATTTLAKLSIGVDGKVLKIFSGTLSWGDDAGAGGGITSFNGLTTAGQTFATSTTGTDFSIVSSGSTHTFNIPSATSIARGLLTSADWATFNNKENAIAASTTATYYRGDKTFQTLNTSVVLENSNLYYTDTRARNALSATGPLSFNSSTGAFGILQASSSASGYLSSADWNTFNNKLGTSLNSGLLWIGNGSNQAVAVALSGDATLSNAGVLTIANNAITSAKIFDGTIANADLASSTIALALGTTGADVNVSGTPASLGGTLTLNIPDASATARGVVSTSTQTFIGDKTFSGNMSVSGALNVVGASTLATTTATSLTLSPMTAGSLLFTSTSGLVSQNNSNLFWDNTNNRLGIGTVAPGAKLDVVGSARFQQTSATDGAADTLASGRGLNIVAGGLGYDQDVYGLAGVASVGGAVSGGSSNTSDIIGVYGKASVAGGVGANTRIFGVYGEGSGTGSFAGYFQGNLYASGNVGIGTASPGAKLMVDGSASGDIQLLVQGAASQTANLLVVENSAGTDVFSIDANGKITIKPSSNVGPALIDGGSVNGVGLLDLKSYDNSTPADRGVLTVRSGMSSLTGATTLLQIGGVTANGGGNETALKISNITPGVGAETAFSVGSGWDTDLAFVDTSPTISIGNTGTLTIGDGANTLLTVADAGTTGNLTVSGNGSFSGTLNVTATSTLASTTATSLTLSPMTAGSLLFSGTGGLVSQNNANLFWDNTNNRLGIGTTPTALLHIQKSSDSGSSAIYPAIKVANSLATQGDGATTYNFSDFVALSGNGAVDARFGAIYNSTYSGGRFGTVTNHPIIISTNDLERMRIAADGNVGIGTTGPGAKLEVSRAASAATAFDEVARITQTSGTNSGAGPGLFFYGGTNNQAMAAIGGWNVEDTLNLQDAKLRFRTSLDGTLSDRMVIDQSGNVGIGTSTPTEKLHLYGTGAVNEMIETASTESTAYWLKNPAGYGAIGLLSDNKLRIVSNMSGSFSGSDGITVTQSGNVGIGTTTPGYVLQVEKAGSGVESAIGINAASTSQAAIYFMNDGVYKTALFRPGNSNDLRVFSASVGAMMTFKESNGNVGIGTTTPGYKLDVNGTLGVAGNSLFTSVTGDNFRFHAAGDSYGGGATDVILSADGLAGQAYNFIKGVADYNGTPSTRFNIDSTGGGYFLGNVGIGTTGPGQKLTVGNVLNWSGLVDAAFKITGSYGVLFQRSTDDSGLLINVGATAASILTNYSNTGVYLPIYITPGGNQPLVLQSSGTGNVGIGTTTPEYLLTMGTGGGYYNQATGAWVNGSDRAYKDNILTLEKYGLETVMGLSPVSYVVKHSGIEQVGFIAQEVRDIVPELVSGEDGAMGVNYGGFAPILVKAIQEQQGQIELLKAGLGVSAESLDNLVLVGGLTVDSIVDLGKDSVGEAVIKTGATEVAVVFEKPYTYQPIITATANDFIDGSYRITNKTTNGFKIEISQTQNKDIPFDWHAFGSKNGIRIFSDGVKENIIVVEPAPIAVEPEPVVTSSEPVSTPETPADAEALADKPADVTPPEIAPEATLEQPAPEVVVEPIVETVTEPIVEPTSPDPAPEPTPTPEPEPAVESPAPVEPAPQTAE